jgi:outer membrane protein assembly factor BamB
MTSNNFMKRQCNYRWGASIVAIAGAALLFGAAAHAEDWPFVRRDKLGSGVAASAVVDEPEILWTYSAGGAAASAGGTVAFEATAVVVDGVVYIGDDAGTVHAVRLTDGTAVWTKPFEESGFLAGGAVDEDQFYLGDAYGVVRCLNLADGEEVWSKEVEAQVYAGPTIDGERLFVTCEAGTLTCFNAADGDELWKFQIDAPLRCAPTIVAGHVLLAGCDSLLHRIDTATGDEIDTVAIDSQTGATAATRGGRAYFGTEGGTFYAIDVSTGEDKQPSVVWTYHDPERGQPIRSAAAVNDQLVCYGGQSKAVYGLDPASGELKWKLPTRSRVDSSPVIAGGRVVAATDRGVLYVLDAATGKAKWQFDAGGGFVASPIVVDGRIIIGNTDGTLYCFGNKHGGEENKANDQAASPGSTAP